MDAIKFLKEKNRMTKKCSIHCADCPLCSEKNTTGLACGDLHKVKCTVGERTNYSVDYFE